MVSITSPSRTNEQRPSDIASPELKVLAVIDGTERTGRVIDYALGLKRHGHTLHVVLLGIVPAPPIDRLRGYGTFKQAEIHSWLKDSMRQRAVSAVARRLDHEKLSMSTASRLAIRPSCASRARRARI